MDNAKKVITYLTELQEEYNNKVNFPSFAMSEIMDEFKDKSGKFTEGALQHGFFRSLEANFVRHPRSYQLATSVDLANNEIWDSAVCAELVKLFRTVGQIERGDL